MTKLSPIAAWFVVLAGLASLFATYWDDAWHTDFGRDDALIPPHLLMFGSVGVVGLIVAGWGLRALLAKRSLIAVLKQPPLLIAGIGGVVTLASAPVDAAWHSAFGRDAVLWSPSHMLTVFGTLALISGVLAGLESTGSVLLGWAAGALLLGSAVATVMEFETDVPQFSEALYLPVLLAAGLYAAALLRALSSRRLAVAGAVGAYVVIRLVITAGLLAMGRTAPDLPLAIVGMAAIDLPWRRTATRYAAATAGVALSTLLATVTGVSSVPIAAVLVEALLVVALFVVMLAMAARPAGGVVLGVLVLGTLALPLSAPEPAWAHDPGQGQSVGTAILTASSKANGTIDLVAIPRGGCGALTPVRLLARRAGQTVSAPLTASSGQCGFSGRLSVDGSGLWFVYAEMRSDGRLVEAWLPVDAGSTKRLSEARDVYLPAGGSSASVGQIVAGVVLYLIGLLMLALTLRLLRAAQRSSSKSG